ncbi:T9SS type A sorting domain-containing protein [Oscillatoria amoena NRMC-F 0135]|nr:T9SS type A sorting domain-containing protein [Oscillatoria amoena NRMC-F 0135]
MLVIKTDANGNAVTGGQFTYGEVDLDRAMRIDQLNGYGTDNDGLAIYGYTSYISPYSLGGYDHMLVKAYFNGVSACQYDMRNANQISGSATHTTAWTGEYWPNSFYDFPFLVDYYQNLQDNQICYATQNADGSNARVAPVAPKGDKEAVVSPNPMAQGSQLAIVEIESNGPATVQVEVFDMLGKLYAAGNYTLAKGKNQLPVDLSSANMAAGMYTVKVTGTAINQNILLIVK